MADKFTRSGIVELVLNTSCGWESGPLTFLAELPFLLALEITDLDLQSITGIEALHELRALDLMTYCGTPIDFAAFPMLQSCVLEWRQGC